MKKIIYLVITLSVLLVTLPICFASSGAWSQQEDAKYIGNSETKVFHTLDCGHGKRIKKENRVYFKTRAEAIEAEYTPCKVCKP